jgi:hypothetical protein
MDLPIEYVVFELGEIIGHLNKQFRPILDRLEEIAGRFEIIADSAEFAVCESRPAITELFKHTPT